MNMTAQPKTPIRLGINVDHIATVRQARGTMYPDPVEAAQLAAQGGADSITIHLREDRRHIQGRDLQRMLTEQPLPVNLEMAAVPEMIDIACAARPRYACLVPERRQELTTEGGLDVAGQIDVIRAACARLADAGIAVALFIDAEPRQLQATLDCRAPHIEIHTGSYANAGAEACAVELARITDFARAADRAGIEVHAGHGLHLANVGAIAAIAEIVELNIGHSVIARALSIGMREATAEMRAAMTAARNGVAAR